MSQFDLLTTDTSEEVGKIPTWNRSDLQAATARGQAGGKLTPHERENLLRASQQAGPEGRAAKEALKKAK